jgi:hypothetical protein
MIKRILICLSAMALLTILASAGLSASKEIKVRGKLKRTVEAGGWLLVTEKKKYLILNAKKFESEKWFVEGTEVEATGKEKRGVVTIYMEGAPFEVSSLRPINQDKSHPSGKPSRANRKGGVFHVAKRRPETMKPRDEKRFMLWVGWGAEAGRYFSESSCS